jgi:hypothetical protein
MVTFLASSIKTVEEEPQIGTLPDLDSAVPAYVGLAERGPLTPTEVSSWDEYTEAFGAYKAGCMMPQTVRSFFSNGGQKCVILRRLNGTPVASNVTLQTAASGATYGTVLGTETETFELAPGDTLDISVDQGADDTATFDAAAASITCATAETYDIDDAQTLLVKIDGGSVQTATFNTADFADIDNATAAEIAAVINQDISGCFADVATDKVRITSDKQGTDSEVEVTGGTANTALGFSTTPVSGTGDVADISAVTVAEIKTVVENDVTGCTVSNVGNAVQIATDTPGVTGYIQVQATSSADTKLGLDNTEHQGTSGAAVDTLKCTASSVGEWGDSLQVRVTTPTSGKHTGNTAEFNLLVIKDSVIIETWPNVSMNDSAANFVETVVNHETTGSLYITVEDQDCGLTAPLDRPAGSTGTAVTSDLGSGSEGSAVDDATFTGGDDFDDLEAADIDLLAVPDRATVAVHNAMIAYCEVTRNGRVVGICDPPAGYTKAQIRTHNDSVTASENIGIYWPRVRIPNPSKTILGSTDLVVIPPSGMICGICARNDADKRAGPFVQPAGVYDGRMLGAVDLESDNHEVLRESTRDEVYPDRINPITWLKGYGVHVDGSRTKKGDGSFPSMGERRGISYIERVLKNGLQWVRHQNNTSALRGKVERTVRGYLLDWTNNGAFASNNPAQAFFVDGDVPGRGINNARVRAQNKLYVRVGIATAKPAEYVVILVSQDTRAIQEASLGR